jgi:hypothetical protein
VGFDFTCKPQGGRREQCKEEAESEGFHLNGIDCK